MLDLRVQYGAFLAIVVSYGLGGSEPAYAQETYVPPSATFSAPSPYQSQIYSAPQVYSGAQIEQYLNPEGMTVLPPPPLFGNGTGAAAGRFPLVQSQPTIEFYTPVPIQQAPVQTAPVAQGGAVEVIPSGTNPIQVISLPNQLPILVPMESGTAAVDGAMGGSVTGLQPPPEVQTSTGGAQTEEGEGGGAATSGDAQDATAESDGAGAGETPPEEAEQADDASKVSQAKSDNDEHEAYKKKQKKEEEYASTLRAMQNMSQAQREAESHLGYAAIQDPTGEHTAVRNQQIMGSAVVEQIKRLSATLQNNVAQASLPEAIKVSLNLAAIQRAIEEEEARLEKERKRLKREAERERKRLERERKKAQREQERRERDQRYRDRHEREDRQEKTADDLNKENKDLKDRADKLDKQQKDFDRIDKELREQEQKSRANDPNCRGEECRAIREQRAELNRLKTDLGKEQTKLQKDAQSFNNKVRDWQEEQRELEDLKDRGYGMNEEERAERRAEQRTDAAKDRLSDIERQKADLRRQAKWMEAEGELDEDAADDLRKQWDALENAETKARAAVTQAEADLLEKQARALGVGDVYDEAMKNYQPSYEGQQPTRPHNLPGLENAMDEARRYQNASDETLDKVNKAYGDALNQLDEIERRIGADPSDPNNHPPVNGNLGGDYAKAIDEYNKIAEELKQINPQGFMNSADYKKATKASYEAGREMEKHQKALEQLGDSEPIGGNVTNLGQGEPATFRSESELARRHSFSFTGPASLQGEVMSERAALEKATADYLSAQDQLANIRDSSAAYQKGQQLWKQLDALDSQIDVMRPLADANALSNDVLQFNSSLTTGLPRGANGEIDQNAVVNNVRAMAQGQMGLLQNGVALDQAQRAAAANPNGQAERQQVDALKSQQRAIIQELQETGVTIKVEDGKFTPTALTDGVGKMWDMARDQTVATLEEIQRNRQAAGVSGAGPTPPGEAGKGRVNAGLDREFRKADAQRAEQDKIADLQPPPSPEAARSHSSDLNRLNSARNALEANINDLDTTLAELPDNHPVAPGLVATRNGLEAALKGVDSAIVKTEQKAQATTVRTQQLNAARAALETNINDIDTTLAELPDYHPVVPGLVATRNGLESALRGVDTAIVRTQQQKPEAKAGTTQLNAARGALERNINDLDTTLAELPDDHPVVPGLVATRNGLEAALKGVDSAIVKADKKAQETTVRTRQLTDARAALERNINDLDGALVELPDDHPVAPGLIATRSGLEAALRGVDAALVEPELKKPQARLHTDQLNSAREALERNINDLDATLVELPDDHPVVPGLIATRGGLEAALKGVDSAIVKIEQPPQDGKERTKHLKTAAAALEKNINSIDERLTEIDGWTPEGAALTATRDSLEAAYVGIDNALSEVAPTAPDPAPQEIEPQQPQTAANPTAAVTPVTLSPEAKATLVQNRDVLAEQVKGLDQQIVALGAHSVHGLVLTQTRDAIKAGLASIEKTLEAPVKPDAIAPPQPVKVSATAAAVPESDAKTDRLAILSDRQSRIVKERLLINERLKSLPEDDPEAQKLRARSEQLNIAQDAIDGALETLSFDQPAAAGESGFETAAKVEAETRTAQIQAIENHPELAELRRQIFERDQNALAMTPGSPAWQAHLQERDQLVARYVARYNTIAREASALVDPPRRPEQAGEQAGEQATPDPAVSYLEWVDQDVLPVLRGGVGATAIRQALTGIVALLGPEKAEQITDTALDATLEFGDGNNAEIFLDEVLKGAAALARDEAGAAAGRSIDMARAQALSALLQDPTIERNAALKEEVSARFGDAAKSLREELGAEIAKSVNKSDTKIALLGELAALSALDGGDLAPLITEFEQELERLAKRQPETGAQGAERAQTLRRLAASLEALQAATPELADRLGKARLASIKLLQAQVSALANSASEEQAGALKSEAAQLVLREAAALLGSGDPAGALDRIRRAGADKDLSPTERDLALLSALDRIRSGWSVLDGNARAALGSLEALERERDQALERLSQSGDPALDAAASLLRARTALAKADLATARRLIDEAIRRQPDDPVLQGEKLRLALSDPSKTASKERIEQALGGLPEALRLPAGLLAIDSLLEGGANGTALALIEKLREMSGATEDAKALGAYLDARKAFALAGLPADAVNSAQVREAIGHARESLTAAVLANPALAGEIERLDALSTQLDEVETLERALADGSAPPEGFTGLAREALAMGRLDIAERALSRHVAELLDPDVVKDNATIIVGLRQSAALLETVRRRAAQPDITPEQRALFDGFTGRIAPQLTGVIDQYLKEREPVARGALNRALSDPKAGATAAQRRNELRMLERLRWSVQATMLQPEQWLQRITEAEAAATGKINDKLAEIRAGFDGLAQAINQDATKSAELDKALVEIDILRAKRDGITDFKLGFAPLAGEVDPRVNRYGALVPKTARDEAIRAAQRNLISVEPGGTAEDLWERRREARRLGGSYQAEGARERLLVQTARAPSSRDLTNKPEAYKNHWLEMRITQRDAAYYERRRAELVFEDPTRPGSAATELLNKLVEHEVAVLNGVVEPSNALSEMVQQITGYGATYRATAGELASHMPQNEINGWLNDLEIARQGGDPQKAFSSLVKLRDASLSGEINAFVNYLDVPWYRAGPARAYNLVIGMTETQTSLEGAIVETARINSVLIRAANNLPESLSGEDRTLLERHGFLKDGKYAIPEHVRVTPTSVASEFAQITHEGVLGKTDQILNAAHVAELTATVAIPGGIAGRLGKSLASELTKAGVRSLVAQGVALTVETAAFTALSRLSRVALDPELLTSREFWSGRAMLAEYGHNLLTLGVLKVKGAGLARLGKSLERLPAGRLRSELDGLARSLDVVGEAALLTTLNGALGSNAISRETFFENLMVVSLLRATHIAGDAGKTALGIPTGQGTGNAGRNVAERGDARGADVRYQQWLDAYHIPARRLMEQFGGDWAAARKAYQKNEISDSQMRRLVELRKSVVDSLSKEILAELGGDVQAFGSTNLTSDYDISFVGPKAQLAVILFNARFGARWGAAMDIGGRETGITLDTNAYTGTEHLSYAGGKLDAWLQDSYAHLAARKYLGDAEWAAYRARVEQASDSAKSGDVASMLDKVESDYRSLREAVEAEQARLKGTVPESDIGITAENRLYEKTLMEIAELIERHQAADPAGKEALAQEIRNAQSRALFYAQEAYNTQAAIQHVVTTIQAAKRAITAESLLAKDPPELNVPLTVDQARQSFIEQIANMLKELSHGGDPDKLAGKAAKYFVRALDAAKIARIDLSALESIVRATVEINDNRAEISDVKKALAQRFPEGGADAYLKGVEDAVNALNRAFFGGAEARTAANDNVPAQGSSAAPSEAAGGAPGAPGEPPAAPRAPADANAETVLNTVPRAASGSRTGSETEIVGGETGDGAARAYAEGIAQLEGDPAFARWLEQPVTDAATRKQLATVGLLRGLLDPIDRIQADLALAAAEALVNTNSDLAGIDLLDVARYVNLHAGRVPSEGSTNARMPSSAQLAAEALLQINPTARITIHDLVAAARIDGARARAALNGARSTIARQGGEITDNTDSLDRNPLASATAEPLTVLNRIDGSYLVQRPRAGAPGDAAFFVANGLTPQLTIEVGGQRYHVTEPFRGPDGRASVVAFQETSLGTIVPRTFYLSGEHGVWRAAVAIAGGLISKGPIRLVYGGQEITPDQMMEMRVAAETQFVNESAVDLGAEIQGTLSRWVGDRGVRDLSPEVMERAFFGHLENGMPLAPGAEFSAFVSRPDVERALAQNESQLPEGLLPDLAAGPLDQWQVTSHVYGELRGATYQSRDGAVIYVVLRDAQGRVFVPSIQDARVGLTPFGTRWSSYQTRLNSTPMTHGVRDYVANDNYANVLNSLFR